MQNKQSTQTLTSSKILCSTMHNKVDWVSTDNIDSNFCGGSSNNSSNLVMENASMCAPMTEQLNAIQIGLDYELNFL